MPVRQQRRQTGAALVLLCSGRLGAFRTRLYLVCLQCLVLLLSVCSFLPLSLFSFLFLSSCFPFCSFLLCFSLFLSPFCTVWGYCWTTVGVGGQHTLVLGREGVAGNWYLGMRRVVGRQQAGDYLWEASVQRRSRNCSWNWNLNRLCIFLDSLRLRFCHICIYICTCTCIWLNLLNL